MAMNEIKVKVKVLHVNHWSNALLERCHWIGENYPDLIHWSQRHDKDRWDWYYDLCHDDAIIFIFRDPKVATHFKLVWAQ
jgi:hypothetical protein